jgi:hypothetical protein
MFATSCSQNEIQENEFNREMKDGIKVSTEGFFPDSAIQKFILENPEYYVFGNSHSDLWVEESSFRSLTAQPSLNAYGYDIKVQISTGTTMFPKGLSCDSRIYTGTYYVYKRYQYKKSIQIPPNATLILPPDDFMITMTPIGTKPGTSSTKGYVSELISHGSDYDTYYLITEGSEITHTASGQQIASLNDPVYLPCHIQIPQNIVFKYQYTEAIEW